MGTVLSGRARAGALNITRGTRRVSAREWGVGAVALSGTWQAS